MLVARLVLVENSIEFDLKWDEVKWKQWRDYRVENEGLRFFLLMSL